MPRRRWGSIASTERKNSMPGSGEDIHISGSQTTTITKRLSSKSFASSVSSPPASRRQTCPSSLIRLSLDDSDDSDGSGKRRTVEDLRKVVVKAAESSRRISVKQRLSMSSLAQLRISSLQLHGREDDMALLKDKLFSMDEGGQELVLVAGVSGVGKSALVARGLKGPAEKRGMAFVKGKFDLNNNALPYSAFAEALSGLARHVTMQSNVAEIKSDIQEALGDDDMAVISKAMQGCGDLFTLEDDHHQRKSTKFNKTGGKESANRMQYAIRRLMKAVCSNLKSGVVMFIDDLQWSDSSSLDLLQALLQDKDIPALLLVGAYRDDEVPESHPLALHVKEAERLGSTISKIELGNLSKQAVQNLVADALNMEDQLEKVETLAQTVYKKTKGNPFFVIFFLKSLYDDELLQYNFASTSWHWDDEKINEKLMTENVASMMANKLRRFEKKAQHIIEVASFLGSSFSTRMLEIVFEKGPSDLFIGDECSIDTATVDDAVSLFENEGLWEHVNESESDTYRFAHDQIQSAASELFPLEKRDALKGCIGWVLFKELDPVMADQCLFDIVSLRNCSASSLSEEDRTDLGHLNIRAGIKASNNAAFDTAVVYFEKARALFGPNAWNVVGTDEIVELYIKEAQARFVVGHLEILETLLAELLSKNLPIQQVYEAYEVKILAAQGANRFDEAIAVALEVRRQLGFEKIPTKPSIITVLLEYRKTNKAVGGRSAEELAAMPVLTDERVAIGQVMLELLCTSTFQGNTPMYPLIVFLAVRETIKYGVSRSSCDGFAGYGLLLSGVLGDPKKGREMGRAGELIAEMPEFKRMRSRVAFHVHGMNYHHTSPLQGTLRPLLEGYQVGLNTGDTESACYCLVFRSCILWLTAGPLKDISSELLTGVAVLNEMNQIGTAKCVLPFLQAARSLCGNGKEPDADRPWVLSGVDFVFETELDFALHTAKNMVLVGCILVAQLDILVMYQQWTAAENLLVEHGDQSKNMPGFFQAVRFVYLEGLVCLKAAQASRSIVSRYKWARRAKKAIKNIKLRIEKGNVNLVQMLQLLTAELHVLNGKPKEAEESFKQAQISARRAGFLQDRALAHELAGLHYMKMGDDYWAKHNIRLSHDAYLDWQAVAMAKHLQGKYPQYFNVQARRRSSLGRRNKARDCAYPTFLEG